MNQFLMSFAEINVQEMSAIRFMMPEMDIGRGDIEITCDYGESEKNPAAIVANVWARVGNSRLKGFICPVSIAKTTFEKEGISSIVEAINGDSAFYEQLRGFLDYAGSVE